MINQVPRRRGSGLPLKWRSFAVNALRSCVLARSGAFASAMELLVIAAILLLAALPAHAEVQLLLKEGYPLTLDREITSLAATNYPCTGSRNTVLISAGSKVYILDIEGKQHGSWNFRAPVYALAPLIFGEDYAHCYAVAGSWDGKVYAFKIESGEQYIETGSWWSYAPNERIYVLQDIDTNADNRADYVLIGIGSYYDIKYGAMYIINHSGTVLSGSNDTFKYSTSDTVKAFANIDLMGRGARTEYAVAYSTSVDVLSVNGSNATLRWSYNTSGAVAALSAADFDGDGAMDGLLVGAGNAVYALNSKKELLWSKDLNASVVSISFVDKDNNGVIDYYVVAAGTKIYALENAKSANVLWSFDTGRSIAKHVSLDLDNGNISDDVAIISGRSLYAYRYAELLLPKLSVSKSVSSAGVAEGESFRVTITLKNAGDGRAMGLELRDSLPEGLALVSGKLEYSGSLGAGEIEEITYTVRALRAGNYTLPKVKATFSDFYGKGYEASSGEVSVAVVKGGISEQKNETKALSPPQLIAERSASRENLSIGENATVQVVIRNLGASPALTIAFNEALPAGLKLLSGNASWKGELPAGGIQTISYAVEAVKAENASYTIPAASIAYRDSQGRNYEARLKETRFNVAQGVDWKKLAPLLAPIPVLAAAAAVLRKRGRLPLEKLRIPKLRRRVNEAELEEKLLEKYREFAAAGKKPTYGDMKKALGVSVEEIEHIVEKIKSRSGK